MPDFYEPDVNGEYAAALDAAMRGENGETMLAFAPCPGVAVKVGTQPIFKPRVGTINPRVVTAPSPAGIVLVAAIQASQLGSLVLHPNEQVKAWAQESAEVMAMWQSTLARSLTASAVAEDDPEPLPSPQAEAQLSKKKPKGTESSQGRRRRKRRRAVRGYARGYTASKLGKAVGTIREVL